MARLRQSSMAGVISARGITFADSKSCSIQWITIPAGAMQGGCAAGPGWLAYWQRAVMRSVQWRKTRASTLRQSARPSSSPESRALAPPRCTSCSRSIRSFKGCRPGSPAPLSRDRRATPGRPTRNFSARLRRWNAATATSPPRSPRTQWLLRRWTNAASCSDRVLYPTCGPAAGQQLPMICGGRSKARRIATRILSACSGWLAAVILISAGCSRTLGISRIWINFLRPSPMPK